MMAQQIVLVVDDSLVDRAICQRFLQRDKRHDYTFLNAERGEAALEICQQSMPDIILLDYKLPDMDGVDLLRRLHTLVPTRYLGIVMLTAQGDETVAVRAMKAGVQDYLPKGKLTAGALCRAVHNVLEQQKLQKQLDWQQEQQQLISAIALRIHQSLDLQVVLDSTVAEVRQFLQADRVLICQVRFDGNSTIRAESVVAGRNRILDCPTIDTYLPSASITKYLQGHHWVADDIYQAGLTSCHLQFLEQLEVKANLVVPILLPGELSGQGQRDDGLMPSLQPESTPPPSRLWGLLIAHQCSGPHCWQQEERQLLDRLATHLAIAIHQAELYQQAKELAEQRRIATILRQERNFISAILDVEGALVVVLDCEGRIVSFNQACQTTTGYTLTEVVGRVFWDFLLLPEEFEAVTAVYQSLRRGELPSQYENYWVAKDGSHHLISWSNTVLFDDTGSVEYLIGTGIDITERKQTEQALRESEAMNRAIRNALPDLTIRMTRGGEFLDFIPAKTFSIIQPYQEMQGKTIFDVLPPDLAHERLRYAELALATGETQIYEYQIEIGGQTFWQEARLVKSGDDEVLVVVRSVHDRKLAEQALAASEARLRAVVQHSFDIIAIIDADGIRRFVNDSVERILGYPTAAMTGRNAFEGIHPDDVERVQLAFQSSLKQPEQPIWVEFRYQHQNGHWVDLELVGTNLLYQAEIHGVVANLRDISARKRTEKDLRESERHYATLADALPVGIFRNDADGNCIYVNDHWSEITGLTVQEGLGLGWMQCVHPDYRDRIFAWWRTVIQHSISDHQAVQFCQEVCLQTRNGVVKWVYCQSVPEIDDSGNVTGYVGSLTDITQQKQIETALRESEQRMLALALNLPSSAYQCVFSADGAISLPFISPGATELMGLSVAEVQANPALLFEMVHPDDRAMFVNWVQYSIATLENFQHEYRIVLRTGETKWVKDLARYSQRDNGDVVANGIAIDISDRKRTEEALQQSEALLRTMFERSGVGIVILNANGQFVQVNPAYEVMLGYSETELQRLTFADLTHEEDCESNLKLFTALIRGECEMYQVEKRYHRRDGDVIWVRVTTSLISTSDDQPSLIMAVIEDVTARRQAQDALQGFNRELEARVEQRTSELRQTVVWLEQEVQERKQAELELRHNRALREAIFNESADAIFLVDSDRLLTIDCNHRAVELFEANHRAELIGIAVHTLQRHPFSQVELQAMIAEMTVTGRWNAEIEYVTRQGKLFWGNLATRVMHVAGNTMHLVRVSDISDRKQTELLQRQQIERELLLASITQRMRESLDLPTVLNTMVTETQRLLQADRVLVYRIAADGTGKAIAEIVVPGWQPILDRVFPSETFPANCYDRYVGGHLCVLPDREQETVLPCLVDFMHMFQIRAKLVAPIIQGNALWGLLIVHQCKAPRHWQEWEVNLLRQLGNQLSIAIQQSELYQQLQLELDERKQAEIQLQQTNMQLSIANGELARATRHKDEFLANMSHELRTPLNAILGMSEALIEETCGSLSERQHKAISTIEKSGKHLLELINDILDLAKIEAGKLELNLSQTAIKTLCTSSFTFVKQMAAKKGIQLLANVPPEIGMIQADARRIQQVLINLLSNAIKFTPEGGSVMLEVWSAAASDIKGLTIDTSLPTQTSSSITYINFSVSDTGIGIAPDYIDKIFQPFVQIDSALNRQFSGTGLGLALVRRIVLMHHGTITLESQVGQGSRFTVHLPQQQLSGRHATAVETGVVSPLPVIESATIRASKAIVPAQPTLRLLLVEDNQANIETIAEYLTFEGYELLVAMNGEEAIAKAKAEHPDLILMDIQMPGIDGCEAMRTIRADTTISTIPIIAVTALAMASDRAKCLTAGANVYLTKPVSLKQLVKQIQQLTTG